MKKLIAIVAAVFLFAYAQVVWASPSPGQGWVPGISPTGQTVWFGPAYATRSSGQMGQAVWDAATSGGGANATIKKSLAVGAGEAAVVLKGAATGANVFAAFKAIMGGPVGLALTVFMTAPAIIDWLNQGNVRFTPKGATHTQPFEIRSQCSGPTPATVAAASETCIAQSGSLNLLPPVVSGGVCSYSYNCGLGTTYQAGSSAVNDSTNWLPASMDDIAPYMTDRAAAAAAIQAMLDAGAAIKITGQSVTGPATTTGGAQVKTTPIPAGPPTVTTTTVPGNPFGLGNNTPTVTGTTTGAKTVNVDGKPYTVATDSKTLSTYNPGPNNTTSTTTTTSEPHTATETATPKTTTTYGTGPNPETGDTVGKTTSSTTTSTVTNITNNTTNTTTTTTSTTTNPATTPPPAPKLDAEQPDYAFADSPLGDIPKLYERKYPDGLVGLWNSKITEIKAAPLFRLVGELMPSLPSSGACPSFMIPVNFGKWGEFGALDFSPPCFVWPFCKLIIIISALLLSRRLIFGG